MAVRIELFGMGLGNGHISPLLISLFNRLAF